jgi:hypothetical protein
VDDARQKIAAFEAAEVIRLMALWGSTPFPPLQPTGVHTGHERCRLFESLPQAKLLFFTSKERRACPRTVQPSTPFIGSLNTRLAVLGNAGFVKIVEL